MDCRILRAKGADGGKEESVKEFEAQKFSQEKEGCGRNIELICGKNSCQKRGPESEGVLLVVKQGQ